MNITNLIGSNISKIRYRHNTDGAEGLKEYQAQIKLSNGEYVLFPKDPKDQIELTSDYNNNKSCNFSAAQRFGLPYRLVFRRKNIVDVHFKYKDGAHYKGSSGIIELDNGKYLMENDMGPLGVTDINLVVLNKSQFEKLNNDGIEFRSFKAGFKADS